MTMLQYNQLPFLISTELYLSTSKRYAKNTVAEIVPTLLPNTIDCLCMHIVVGDHYVAKPYISG
jgi:hypothetical protein